MHQNFFFAIQYLRKRGLHEKKLEIQYFESLICFNDTLTHLELFYTLKLGDEEKSNKNNFKQFCLTLRALTDTNILCQGRPRSNGNEEAFPRLPKLEFHQSDKI